MSGRTHYCRRGGQGWFTPCGYTSERKPGLSISTDPARVICATCRGFLRRAGLL